MNVSSAGTPSRPPGVPMDILVVDDDADTRGLLFQLLDQEGHRVTTVAGGIEAVRSLSHRPFDLVISDLRMGDMHGAEVVRNVRRFWPGTPVILITAFPEDPLLQDALTGGAVDLIVKPFRTEEFLGSVERALRTSPHRTR